MPARQVLLFPHPVLKKQARALRTEERAEADRVDSLRTDVFRRKRQAT